LEKETKEIPESVYKKALYIVFSIAVFYLCVVLVIGFFSG